MSLFNSKNFSFTCLHSFYLFLLLRQQRIEFPNVRANEMCARPVLTAVSNSSPNSSKVNDVTPVSGVTPITLQILALRMFSHTIVLSLGQEASYTVLIDLGLTELRKVRDSAAPRSYVDWRSRAFSDSRAWLRKARSYIG